MPATPPWSEMRESVIADMSGLISRHAALKSGGTLMMTMRACRSAVMIGTALELSKMKQIVSQLARLDQPWNCPHGRPTLRHLVDLEQLANTAAATEFEQSRLLT